MAHPQNSPRGLFAKSAVTLGGSSLDASDITFNSTGGKFAVGLYLSDSTAQIMTANSTGFISSGALYVSGKTQSKITANSTTTTVANAFAVSGQATVGKLAANSTALILPATGFQMAAQTTLKVTSDSTGVKIGSLYISCNSTGNTTT